MASIELAVVQPPILHGPPLIVSYGGREVLPNGQFTMNSACDFIVSQHYRPEAGVRPSIWSWNGPQWICAFLWLIQHNRLLTNVLLAARGLHRSDASCPRLRAAWEEIVLRHERLVFFFDTREERLGRNMEEPTSNGSDPSWAMTIEL